MKLYLYLLVFLVAFPCYSQNTIRGSFSPAADYTWLIAYKLQADGQNYIEDTRISKGKFSLKLPKDSPSGTYRLVYAVPQDEFYFDIIYNGKEDISLDFNTQSGLSFRDSRENIIFQRYFRDIRLIEQEIQAFYVSESKDKKHFAELTQQLSQTQQEYENASEGLLVNLFIRSNAPYIPSGYESLEAFVSHRKHSYFKALELDNPELQASGFLTDKLINFVFTALPLKHMDSTETQHYMIENAALLADHLKAVRSNYKLHLFYTLWSDTVANGFQIVSDYLYNQHLKALASEMQQNEIINQIETHNRLRIGAIAPEIEWISGKDFYKLSSLPENDKYLLVFWSSSCSHCLNELPKLHEALLPNTGFTVIAVGLEDDDINWKKEAAKLSHFKHALALGKWESEYANLYAILQTPTYFILDNDKKIIAKPEDYEEVLEFIKANSGP